MKQIKTQRKSVLQAAQKAAQQSTVDKKEFQKDCDHHNWNYDLFSHCPDCDMNLAEILINPRVYKSDRTI